MKVCFISSSILTTPPTRDGKLSYGGIEYLCYEYAKHFYKNGHDVTIITTKGSKTKDYYGKYPNMKVIETVEPYGRFTKTCEFDMFKKYIHLLESTDYDAVLDFGHGKYYARTDDNTKTLNMIWHNCTEHVDMPRYNNVALSDWQSIQINKKYGLGSIVLGMCLDEMMYIPTPDVSKRFLFLGRIDPRKGVHNAIQECVKADVPLDIVGGTPADTHPLFNKYLNETMEYIKDHSNIRYYGEVSQEEKVRLIQEARAVILPYVPDAHSLVLIESMLCGTPVIALESGAFTELNIHGHTGFNMKSASFMHKAIENIDMISREDVRQYAMDNFSFGAVMPRYFGLCKSVRDGLKW